MGALDVECPTCGALAGGECGWGDKRLGPLAYGGPDCVHPSRLERYAIHRNSVQQTMDTLAANLAWGGALCRAWELGRQFCWSAMLETDEGWKHGCGRRAP